MKCIHGSPWQRYSPGIKSYMYLHFIHNSVEHTFVNAFIQTHTHTDTQREPLRQRENYLPHSTGLKGKQLVEKHVSKTTQWRTKDMAGCGHGPYHHYNIALSASATILLHCTDTCTCTSLHVIVHCTVVDMGEIEAQRYVIRYLN